MAITFSSQDVAGDNRGIKVGSSSNTGIPVGSTTNQVTLTPQYTVPTQNQYIGTPGNVLAGNAGNTGNTGNYTAPAPAKPVLNRAAIDNTQGSIDQLAGMLQRALEAEQQAYDNAETEFNTQETEQRGAYDQNTTTNQLNYDRNLMASLRSGAKGLTGLLSILRGTGAENWAQDAVRDTTNNDIIQGLDARNENQTALDSSLTGFLNELSGKRRANKETLQNNQYAHMGRNASEAQRLYKEMAGIYSDAEDTDNATRFMNKAGEYTPDIAKYSVAPVGKFDTTRVQVKAAPITAFDGPTKQNVGYDGGNSSQGVFTLGNTRRRLAGTEA